MNGHHHAQLSDESCINEPDEDRFVSQVREAIGEGLGVYRIGFVCTYGCGKLHPAANEVLKRIFDPEEEVSHAS